MNGGVYQYGGGPGGPSNYIVLRDSRSLAKKRRDTYEEGALTDFQEDIVFGIGQRNMQRAAMLDMQRIVLAGDNPALNSILAEIEFSTINQAKRIQNGLFGGEDY